MQTSTGEPKVQLGLSKAKENVDHVGLSQLLLVSNQLAKSSTDNLRASPNNNLLIVISQTEVALEDKWDSPSTMLSNMAASMNKNILTKVQEESVTK